MDPKNLSVLMQLKQSMEESTPKPARRSGIELSEESIRAIQESVKRRFEEGIALQNPKIAKAPELQRRECISCKEVYAVEPDRLRPYWICTHCKHLKKQRRREEAEAKVAAQYANATGTKINQIEKSITALKARIAVGTEPNQRDLLIQLVALEKKLALEKVHTISKLGSIRARKVPGTDNCSPQNPSQDILESIRPTLGGPVNSFFLHRPTVAFPSVCFSATRAQGPKAKRLLPTT